ncbi:MAG: TIR domain-containing protein, partial [Pirellula sp.]
MPHQTHHLFFSYSRLDNKPQGGSSEGWITAFYNRLQTQHKLYTGRELRIFFDTEAIDHGSDWKARLGQGLRTSNLFLAFLSPNYMRSKNCRWEWEEYLRREHSLARGDDGIRTVFFEIVPGMPGISKLPDYDEGKVQALERELRADQEIARWLDMVSEEFRRRNNYLDQANALNPRATFVLQPWFSKGPQILAELDASERLVQLRADPQSDKEKIVDLAERLKSMDEHIATRLDRCLLADLAPGLESLGAIYPYFVGRHKELRELHYALTSDKAGVVSVVHGLG